MEIDPLKMCRETEKNIQDVLKAGRLKSFVSVMHSGCEGNSLIDFDVLIKITAHATDLNLNGIVPRNIYKYI